jgi:DhnA family fructose-bisphosphate aldolase class Ia
MGADAVLVSVPPAGELLERFGRIAEDARRLGMPLLAEVGGDDWLDAAQTAADCGADAIQARFAPDGGSRRLKRSLGRPFVASIGHEPQPSFDLLQDVYELMQGVAEGILLTRAACLDLPLLKAVQALVHQGITVEEAATIAAA